MSKIIGLKSLFAGVALAALASCTTVKQRVEGASLGSGGPRYAVDATWPKPLPNQWILGQVAGIATAKDDTIWMVHRPLTLTEDERGSTLNPKRSKCCSAAPPVLQFDRDGNLGRGPAASRGGIMGAGLRRRPHEGR